MNESEPVKKQSSSIPTILSRTGMPMRTEGGNTNKKKIITLTSFEGRKTIARIRKSGIKIRS